jgi:hypothetical protein
MNREYALELIESRVDQYMNIPIELHRGFAMGLARFALESNLITADEYIIYCDRMNNVCYSKTNQLEKVYKVMDSALEQYGSNKSDVNFGRAWGVAKLAFELSIITYDQFDVYIGSLLWVKQHG